MKFFWNKRFKTSKGKKIRGTFFRRKNNWFFLLICVWKMSQSETKIAQNIGSCVFDNLSDFFVKLDSPEAPDGFSSYAVCLLKENFVVY